MQDRARGGRDPSSSSSWRCSRGFDLTDMSPAELVHTVTECAKLAFADRDALYGDADVPLDRLLSTDYNDERRRLVGEDASHELRPGGGRLPAADRGGGALGAGEPTLARDTVHLDVADRFGNLVSATPSGGWLHSSPTIPALGWPLGTRAQMFWLEEGLPSSLAPRKRPRTTLSPALALREGEPYLAFGTPGGDQQDQWSLHVFLAHVHFGLNLQASIDAPEFHTDHFPSSFFPRRRGSARWRSRRGWERAIDELRARGHDLTFPSRGRSAASGGRARDGRLKAAANARRMQGYAVGR